MVKLLIKPSKQGRTSMNTFKVSMQQLSTELVFRKRSINGFTLIEVLLSLAIIAIAFTALMKASAQNIVGAQQVKNKTISHWVAHQGIQLIQLGLVKATTAEEVTEATTLFNEKWYWRAKIQATPVKSIQKIIVTVSQTQSGPFTNGMVAYRFIP